MFQYAAGLAISLETRVPLAVCIDTFDSYKLHNGFELKQVFGISNEVFTEPDLRRLIGWRASPTVRQLLARLPALELLYGQNFVAERFGTTTSEDFYRIPADTYIHGYWQSESFFNRHKDQIRAAFTFSDAIDSDNAALLVRIGVQQSASIHLRRGDYLTAKNSRIYHQCTPEYYITSMKKLEERVGAVKFFVFSDDPEWAREFFADKAYDCEIVDQNKGPASFNDLRLMSACNHNIIANSSFSWWGAWLNSKTDKTIIAPRQWMKGVESTRIIPSDWLIF